MRRIALFLSLIVLPLPLATGAAASQRDGVTIETQKPFGPSPGTFSATGAMSDAGTFFNSSIAFGGLGAPNFVSVHVTQTFEGALGTFTLRADIKETATEDPNVLTDDGTWAVVDGTGAYETLRGQGQVTGTADDNIDVISRTYAGTVRLH
jgi:hypothetical protein